MDANTLLKNFETDLDRLPLESEEKARHIVDTLFQLALKVAKRYTSKTEKTKLLELTEEEINFISSCIAEVHNEYNEDGQITLFNRSYKEQMVQTLGGKLED